jgi:diadenylate cyclase
MQKDRIGALILFERKTKLGEIVKTGTVLNADMSSEIICNIFYPKAPLHDGAMILRDGRVFAAGCFLPLSQNQEISRELGTRHRAALGISESCDVLVVVLSEESGVISLVQNGVIKRNLTIDTLRIALEKGLLPDKPSEKKDKKTGDKVLNE